VTQPNQAQRELDEAVAEWLETYKGHERYLSATQRLFTVFSRTWQGSSRHLGDAFSVYREALLRNSGYKRAEVADVFPKQRPERGR
jgi:hypothetical protein